MTKPKNILDDFITKENLIYFVCGFVLAVNLIALSVGYFYFYKEIQLQRKAIIVNQTALKTSGILK